MDFELKTEFVPRGDQPKAIAELVRGITQKMRMQTLLGVTGSGKTFSVAQVIARVKKPTLILAPNKTLAAQLYSELKELFPENAVEYFVSYYSYYQPEAYVPKTDTYIEKDADINKEIEKLRLKATEAIMTRRDTIIVASVSCIYGLGNPKEYKKQTMLIKKGQETEREELLRKLVSIYYKRNDVELKHGTFRVRGSTIDIHSPNKNEITRIELDCDRVKEIGLLEPLTLKKKAGAEAKIIFPAKHFVTTQDKLFAAMKNIKFELKERLKELKEDGKLLEAQRLEQRTKFDIEMLKETGHCAGIENYSRHISKRTAGTPPFTLIDYFPKDFLLVIDESHIAVPQIRGMYKGDKSRKQTLVDFGFRLPSALDNRPLKFEEFEKKLSQVIFTSATPGEYETKNSDRVVEQIIRPTGLVDPKIEVRKTKGQIDNLYSEIRKRATAGERVLVTTLTKRMAENLTKHLKAHGIRARYLHSDIDTLERMEIIRDLRLGRFDCLIGINLLREGLDIPEVSLVAILDADKQGFLRNARSLIQTVGRAARNANGKVIMYADEVTRGMEEAIDETNRRRKIQILFNKRHNITPQTIKSKIKDSMLKKKIISQEREESLTKKKELIVELEYEMMLAAERLDFEKAIELREQIKKLSKEIGGGNGRRKKTHNN